MTSRSRCYFVILALLFAGSAWAQDDEPQMVPAPDRDADEGEGPYGRLIIRGATLIALLSPYGSQASVEDYAERGFRSSRELYVTLHRYLR